MRSWKRLSLLRVASAALAALILPCIARAELGWEEAEYVKRFGQAKRSPLAADEARFEIGKGGVLLVAFADGRSREEVWIIDRDDSFVPKDLLQRARDAVQGKPVRRVTFQLESAPAAEIFETTDETTVVQVDYRNRWIARIARCRASTPCTWLSRLLDAERKTDDLMARSRPQQRKKR